MEVSASHCPLHSWEGAEVWGGEGDVVMDLQERKRKSREGKLRIEKKRALTGGRSGPEEAQGSSSVAHLNGGEEYTGAH